MKNIMITLTVVSLLVLSGHAENEANSGAALTEDLIKLEKQSWEAWKNHDGRFFQNFLSDDHVEIISSGVIDKRSIVEGVAGAQCQVKSYSLDHFELKLLNENTGLLTYWETQDTVCGDRPVPTPCWASSLYMKRDGRWLNVMYQQTKATK